MSKFTEIFESVQKESLTIDECVKLLTLIQFKRGRIGANTLRTLNIGARVKIVSTKGTKYGILLKINKTRCHVKVDNDFITWNVPFGMITAE